MIYRSSYLSKELQQARRGRRAGSWRVTAFGLFLGLLSFALYFMAQTMTESVFAESVPQVMQANYFSTLYIYLHVAAVIHTIYLLVFHEVIFFGDIAKKAWYSLIQLGYRPASLILSKTAALFIFTFYSYSLGFGFTVFLTFFLKYALVSAYMPALYLAGLIDVFLIGAAALFLSAMLKTAVNARYLTFLALILVFVLKSATGFSRILSNSLAMRKIETLWDLEKSIYFPLAAALILILTLAAAIRAGLLTRRYPLFPGRYEAVLKDQPPLVRISRTGRRKKIGHPSRPRGKHVLDVTISILLVVFILAAILFNVAILVLNATAKGKIASFGGVIPYVFKSSTMEPEIKVNDLAFFRKLEGKTAVEAGQVILFEQDQEIFVERVIKIEGAGHYAVDIDNYPHESEYETMVKTVLEEEIIAIYSGRSRWLGAVILFANTIFGRILFLLIPAILLFFQRSAADWVTQKKKPAR